MSPCLQTFSVDFLELLLKRRHLKNLKKSANKFAKKNDEKEISDSNIDLLRKFHLRNMFLNI